MNLLLFCPSSVARIRIFGRIAVNSLVLLCAKAGTAIVHRSHCNPVCPSVRPSVCHTGGSVKNDAS